MRTLRRKHFLGVVLLGWFLSSAVRLEFNTDPFSYQVKKRGSGEVLVAQAGMTTVTDSRYTVRGDIIRLNNKWGRNWKPKLNIEVFAGAKGVSEFNYFTGGSVQKITASCEGDNLTVQFGDLGAKGSLELLCRKSEGSYAKRNEAA